MAALHSNLFWRMVGVIDYPYNSLPSEAALIDPEYHDNFLPISPDVQAHSCKSIVLRSTADVELVILGQSCS